MSALRTTPSAWLLARRAADAAYHAANPGLADWAADMRADEDAFRREHPEFSGIRDGAVAQLHEVGR